MKTDYLNELIKDYNPNRTAEYRKAFFFLFKRKPNSCNCDNGKIFNQIRTEIQNNFNKN